MMKYYLKLFRIDSSGAYVEDLSTQIYVSNCNLRRSAEPKNNTGTVTFNNPIIDFFSDGTPRRLFVDELGDSYFKATQRDAGFDSFEEKVEIYIKDVSDIDEDIVVEENLIFSGQIKDVAFEHERKKCNVNLTLSDRTFNILNRIWSNNYDSFTAPEVSQNVIRQVTEDNSASNRGAFDRDGVTGNLDSHFLIDARLFTEGVKTGRETITAFAAKTITCSAATFVTDGVAVGDAIKNETNFKLALVKEVVSETEITISKNIFKVGDEIKISDGFIQDWRTDGTAFPLIKYGESKKPAIEWISKLTQIDLLNTSEEMETAVVVKRPLKYYIDGKNRYHQFYPDDTPSTNIKIGATTEQGDDRNTYRTYKSKMKKGIFDVINFIIFNYGEDMNGKSHTWYAQDPSAGGPNVKDSARPMNKISEYMKKQDAIAGNIEYVSGTTYNYPTSYPMTPAWNSAASPSVADDAAYNAAFLVEGRKRGRYWALRIINQSANPRWKGNIETAFFNFNPSDLVDFTDTDLGIRSQLVRIKEVQHNINKGGFFSTITLEEDLKEYEIVV